MGGNTVEHQLEPQALGMCHAAFIIESRRHDSLVEGRVFEADSARPEKLMIRQRLHLAAEGIINA
jgi:hypothetical protein